MTDSNTEYKLQCRPDPEQDRDGMIEIAARRATEKWREMDGLIEEIANDNRHS